MALKEKDFIEVEFVGKTKEGEVFDSNIKSELEKINSNAPAKPFVFSLGQGMFLKGVDEFLIGKDIGKHKIELTPENAFGQRNPKMIQLMPLKIFHQQKINPVVGAMFNFDGRIAKIISVSGGRVMVDFNNPIAGKEVIYEVNIKRQITEVKEKVASLLEFLFRQDLKFEIVDTKVILEVDSQLKQFVELFKDKFKEILGLDLETKEIKEKETKPSA